jgi:hypothetical protein
MNAERVLLGLARFVMPARRQHWIDAMRIESTQVPKDERLRWALGCLLTSLQQRFDPMNTGNWHVSRGVMLVESVGAFGPLTLGWYEITFGLSGIVRLDGEVIDRYFLPYPGGTYLLAMMFVNVVAGLLGPIGLFLGARYAFTGRGIERGALGWILFGTPLLTNVLGTVAGRLWGPGDFSVPLGFSLLFAWLPAMVVFHLMWLGRSTPPPSPCAAAA